MLNLKVGLLCTSLVAVVGLVTYKGIKKKVSGNKEKYCSNRENDPWQWGIDEKTGDFTKSGFSGYAGGSYCNFGGAETTGYANAASVFTNEAENNGFLNETDNTVFKNECVESVWDDSLYSDSAYFDSSNDTGDGVEGMSYNDDANDDAFDNVFNNWDDTTSDESDETQNEVVSDVVTKVIDFGKFVQKQLHSPTVKKAKKTVLKGVKSLLHSVEKTIESIELEDVATVADCCSDVVD